MKKTIVLMLSGFQGSLRSSVREFAGIAVLSCLLCAFVTPAAPAEPVGTTSGVQTATILLSSSFTLGSIGVVTQGAAGLDFNIASGGTCTVGASYTAGQTCSVNYTFTPTAPGARMGAIVLFDNTTPTAVVESTTYLTGTGNGPMAAFYPGSQTTLFTSLGMDIVAVAVDGSGNFYLIEDSQVLKETLSGGAYTQSTVGNCFSNPMNVALDGAGNVYIDCGNNGPPNYGYIVKETLSGGSYTQSTLVSGLYSSNAVTVDGSGNVYYAYTTGSAYSYVVKMTLSGGSYTSSVVANTTNNGLAWSTSMAVDGVGNLYIADCYNFRVLKETLSGGSYTQSTVGSGLNCPWSVAVDGSGNVYIGDYSNSRVLMETLSGGSYTQSTVGSGFSDSYLSVALDGSGNVYVGDWMNRRVVKVDVSDPPALSFASTAVGATSSDSPQTVTLWNLGNSTLNFPVPASGNNPSVTPNFTLNSNEATACPLIASTASSEGTLALGTSCTLPISFAPTTSGSISGSLTLTDNTLNKTNTAQTITLNGTATGPTLSSIAITPTSASILTGGTQQFTATGTYSDSSTLNLTNSAVWASSKMGVAMIGSGGLATAVAPGSTNITASLDGITSNTSVLTVPAPGFTLAGTSVTLAPGATTGNTSAITVTPAGGFTGSVALTAAVTSSPTGAVNLPTLSFGSTTPVSITGVAAGTATLTITTTAAVSCNAENRMQRGVPWYAGGGAVLACVLLFGIPARRRSWRTMLGMMALLAALSGGVLACGGGGSGGTCTSINPGTTTGAYIITVTGTSGTNSATGTITLNVN